MERRSTAILVKVSPSEKGLIKAHAATVGLTLSEYVRRMSLAEWGRVKASAQDRRTRELTVELKRIGTNLNQITRRVNATRDGLHDPSSILHPLTETLGEINATMQEMQRSIRPSQSGQTMMAADDARRAQRVLNGHSKQRTTLEVFRAHRLRFRSFFEKHGRPETLSAETLIDLYDLVMEHQRVTDDLLHEPLSLGRLEETPQILEDLRRQAETFRLLRDRVNAFSLSELFTPYQQALDLTLELIRTLDDLYPP